MRLKPITHLPNTYADNDIVVSADYEYGKQPSDAKQMFTYEARRP